MAVMLNEITTALPYFVALERIASANPNAVETVLALAIYNAMFSLPLFIFLGLLLRYRTKFATQLNQINAFVQRWTPRIMKYGVLIFGAILLFSGAAYFAGITSMVN